MRTETSCNMTNKPSKRQGLKKPKKTLVARIERKVTKILSSDPIFKCFLSNHYFTMLLAVYNCFCYCMWRGCRKVQFSISDQISEFILESFLVGLRTFLQVIV